MVLYRDTYRVESARLPNWDYSWEAKYFITIVTQNSEHFFGEIVDGEMILNDIGKITNTEWGKTSDIRPDMNITIHNFCIMPNHFHAIIEIGKNEYNKRVIDYGTNYGAMDDRRDAMHCVSTPNATPNPTPGIAHDKIPNPRKPKNKFGPQSKNLGSIMRGFKSTVKIQAQIINPDFEWQSRYHDHIIRNNSDYHRIKKYIINNPKQWDDDKFNSIN